MEIKHEHTAVSNEVIESDFWNANHIMDDITTSANVTFVGKLAGSNATGSEPTLVGYRAGVDNPGKGLTAIGAWAADAGSGDYNVYVGYSAGYAASGTVCTAFGYEAGSDSTGLYLTAFGYRAGKDNTGTYCTGVGSRTLQNNSGNNVAAIGYNAGYNNAVANQLIIKQANINVIPLIQGDFSTGNVAIGKTSAGSKLGVAGLPVYANNAAALVGGLTAGDFYRTGADPDPVCVVH